MPSIIKPRSFKHAVDYLNGQRKTVKSDLLRAEASLLRSKKLLENLDNPQTRLSAIHIAGTSGKGSTATLVSQILTMHGFKVGLLLSPHVYDIRERCQINNQFISKPKFVKYVNEILPVVEKLKSSGHDLTHNEVLTALGFVIIVNENIDYAVIETGLGGKYDFTNLLQHSDTVCLLSPIGLDHTDILGNTITAIAKQKAGIIKPNSQVFSAPQVSAAKKIITNEAKKQRARLEFINVQQLTNFVKRPLDKLNKQLAGNHQLVNTALALAACKYLSKRDGWKLSAAKFVTAIQKVYLPGRFEEIRLRDRIFILDGAHNQQKIDALLKTLIEKYSGENLGIILAIGEQKPTPRIRGPGLVIATSYGDEYQDMPNKGKPPRLLAKQLGQLNPHLQVEIANVPRLALKQALKSEIKLWLVTGSFFILKDMRELINATA